MSPESQQNPLSGMPASSPSTSGYTSAPSSQSQTVPSTMTLSDITPASIDMAEEVSAQAKALVEQYAHDPYRLCGALQQLKAKYLAAQFHISVKTTEN